MTRIVRHCPDCGWDRPFEQHHDEPGGCPDSPDGDCPEWSCTACGAALLIGAAWPAPARLAPAAQLRGRVA
jgi:hypothetical protein